MYIVTIHNLSKQGNVRSIKVAQAMNLSRATVSITIRNLIKDNYVKIDSDGFLSLEPKGLEIAERISNLHEVISKMLINIGVSEEIAEADACKLEHGISLETYICIKKYLNQK